MHRPLHNRTSRFGLRPSDFGFHSARAFSLLELVGVLAVIAILASLLVPVVIRRVDEAARTREASDLAAISNSLVLHIVRSNTIPSGATWSADAGNFSMLPASAITKNPRGHGRVLFIDTGGWLGTNTLPYQQSAQGSPTAPTGARMMLVSCLSGPNGVSQTSGPLPGNLFSDIWNTPARTKPSTWTAWNGNPEDLLIQRINLQPLFHRVLLFNQFGTNAACAYSINGSPNVPIAREVSAHFLDGSLLGLYTNSVLQFSAIINRDFSSIYQGSLWSDQPGPGPGTISSTNLDNIAYAFINSPSPPSSKRGDNTYGIAGTLLAYMSSYSSWANLSPCFSYLGQGQNNPNKVAQAAIINTVNNCFGNPGISGCLIVP